LLAVFPRRLELPSSTFFLFGPRGTGKTTWLRSVVPSSSYWIDLILDTELVRLSREPARFTAEVEAQRPGSWVVVDEVQRLPRLLDRVQDLIARHGPKRHRFALTGSSARKLRRGEANLLPGRAINRRFFPLVSAELGNRFELDAALRTGTLPAVWDSAASERERIDLLDAYVHSYLTQEIRAEAMVKDLAPFTRFLDVAALANGQVTNTSGLARDAEVARPTVQGYFEVLVDTMLGSWLPAWRPRARVKESGHPKFYFFDTGVVRAITGRAREPLSEPERGHLLETYILHELRAWIAIGGCGGDLRYWRTPSGSEVDFIWTRSKRSVGIEVKASTRWRREDGAALAQLHAEGVVGRAIGVYRGSRSLRDGDVEVLPVGEFLRALWEGEIFD
jgi:predicted AAA+ superfamily ATPase